MQGRICLKHLLYLHTQLLLELLKCRCLGVELAGLLPLAKELLKLLNHGGQLCGNWRGNWRGNLLRYWLGNPVEGPSCGHGRCGRLLVQDTKLRNRAGRDYRGIRTGAGDGGLRTYGRN